MLSRFPHLWYAPGRGELNKSSSPVEGFDNGLILSLNIVESYYEHLLWKLRPWPWHFDTLTDWSQIYKDAIKAEYKISSDSIWKPCDIKSEQLPSELQNIKSAFNLRSYVLRVFYKTKLKYNRRKAYLFPQTIKLSYSTEQCSSCNFAVADRPPNVSRHRKTHSFPLENSWAHFLLVCEAFKSAFWSKMERKEWKPAFTIFALDWTRQTPFCKYVLPPLSQPLPPKRNLVGETGEQGYYAPSGVSRVQAM